ncbi:DUF6000 family protein [Streptomyces scabiei]|uniref:DUF6000 family protein n=1 Tax=Streptomyces scabiei TaxID=1930 RepID=UPI0029B87D75|nr:DUF6000 family protein [Streptomyces scabiei]MDX3516720.1 DUF6000 family protein [Streptomyces scabiei]
MPSRHPKEVGYGHVVESYVTRMYGGLPRYLVRLDAHLGTHHADRFTQPDGLWDQWVNALTHLPDHPAHNPAELRRWTDLQCDFANSWSR